MSSDGRLNDRPSRPELLQHERSRPRIYSSSRPKRSEDPGFLFPYVQSSYSRLRAADGVKHDSYRYSNSIHSTHDSYRDSNSSYPTPAPPSTIPLRRPRPPSLNISGAEPFYSLQYPERSRSSPRGGSGGDYGERAKERREESIQNNYLNEPLSITDTSFQSSYSKSKGGSATSDNIYKIPESESRDPGESLANSNLPKNSRRSFGNNGTLSRALRLGLLSELEGDSIPADSSQIEERKAAWDSLADSGDYDADMELVDPHTYYAWLLHMERTVVEESELNRCGGKLNPALDSDVHDFTAAQLKSHDILTHRAREMEISNRSTIFASLHESLRIISNVYSHIEQLRAANYCKDSFSFLLLRKAKEDQFAELIEIPVDLVGSLQQRTAWAISGISSTPIEDSIFFARYLRPIALSCFTIIQLFRIPRSQLSMSFDFTSNVLMLCRMTALLLDVSLVSYVGSHASRFDKNYLCQDLKELLVRSPVEDTFDFRLSLMPLACLKGFLDERQVWVFEVLSNGAEASTTDSTRGQGLSILSTMESIALIWGPVWATPVNSVKSASEGSRIAHYKVSKGIIYPINRRSPVPDATLCHWDNSTGFFRRFTSRFSQSSATNLFLRPGQLLLIGAYLTDNSSCSYSLENFERDYGTEMGMLGARPATWQLDSRAISTSISAKAATFQLAGTQKRIPHTPIKQKIIDRWSYNPQRANVAVLNRYFGVEISHCTGNARRISLRKMLCSESMLPILISQAPNIRKSAWGREFLEALASDDNKDLHRVWEIHYSKRRAIADLVVRGLEIVEATGCLDDKFVAAFVKHNPLDERSIKLPYTGNEWARLLVDSHLTAVFAFINKNCLELVTPSNNISACSARKNVTKKFTILKTMLAAKTSELKSIHLETSKHNLVEDSQDGLPCKIMTLQARLFPSKLSRGQKGREAEEQDRSGRDRYIVHIRASSASFSGWQNCLSRSSSTKISDKNEKKKMPTSDQPSQSGSFPVRPGLLRFSQDEISIASTPILSLTTNEHVPSVDRSSPSNMQSSISRSHRRLATRHPPYV